MPRRIETLTVSATVDVADVLQDLPAAALRAELLARGEDNDAAPLLDDLWRAHEAGDAVHFAVCFMRLRSALCPAVPTRGLCHAPLISFVEGRPQ